MAKYTQTMLTKIYKRIVGALSGLGDIGIELHPDCCPCCEYDETDKVNKVMTLPVIPFARDDEEDFHIGRGIVLHESSHILFAPGYNEAMQKITRNMTKQEREKVKHKHDQSMITYHPDCCPKVTPEFFNIFLDCNNEHKLAKLFPHLEKHLADKTQILFDIKPERLKTKNPLAQINVRIDSLTDIPMVHSDEYGEQMKNFIDWVVQEFKKNQIEQVNTDVLCKFTGDVVLRWIKEQGDEHKKNENIQKQLAKLTNKMGKEIRKGNEEKVKEIEKEMEKLNREISKDFHQDIKPDQEMIRPLSKIQPHKELSNVTLEQAKQILEQNKQDSLKKETGPGWGNDGFKRQSRVRKVSPSEAFGGY